MPASASLRGFARRARGGQVKRLFAAASGPEPSRLTLILAGIAAVLVVLVLIELAERYPLSWSEIERAAVPFTNGINRACGREKGAAEG